MKNLRSSKLRTPFIRDSKEHFQDTWGNAYLLPINLFLQEPLSKDGEEAFKKYIQYLDSLPTFELSREEQDYVDELSSSFNMKTFKRG